MNPGETFGTDGKKCPLVCIPNCDDDELICPGTILSNGCQENDYCHPKGKSSDGSTCPGFCPDECESDEILCSSPSDTNTGCDVAPVCLPKQKDDNGNECTYQQCPLTCTDTEELCKGSLDHQGCREEDSCITKGTSNSGELCPGICPVNCHEQEIKCKGQVIFGGGPYAGCVDSDECKPKAKDLNREYCPDESASHECPITCPPEEVVCPPSTTTLGCLEEAECSPKSKDGDGNWCPYESDCPPNCDPNEVACPGGTDQNGCKVPDICLHQDRDINGNLCTVHCPEDCEENEVLCPGSKNDLGCPGPDICVVRPIKTTGNDEGGLCPGWCPAICEHNEILCPSQTDPCDGCPTEEICVPAKTDKNGDFCPGLDPQNEQLSSSHGCPTLCDVLNGYVLCPSEEDSIGCKPEAECRLLSVDANGQYCPSHSVCPVLCKSDEILCHNGIDSVGCSIQDSCIPIGQDKDGVNCERSCPPQCTEQQARCGGKELPNGCFGADTCVDLTQDSDGNLCPVVCPIECKQDEISIPGGLDSKGCPIPSVCIKNEAVEPYNVEPYSLDPYNVKDPTSCFEKETKYPGALANGGKPIKDIFTAKECQQRCQSNNQCYYFTWSSATSTKNPNTCWLKKSIKESQSAEDKISGPKYCSGNDPLCLDEKVEYTGDKCSNIEPFETKTFDACYSRYLEENAKDPSCKFFVYRAFLSGRDGTCLLKKKKGNANPNIDAISGPKKCPATLSPVCTDDGIEYTGEKCRNIEPFETKTLDECYTRFIEQNEKDPSCKFYTYRGFSSGNKGTCLLKKKKGNSNGNNDAISGSTKTNC